MKPSPILILLCAWTTISGYPSDYSIHEFEKLHLDKYYWSEGANFGDLNNDGKLDAISGPYWWAGPSYNDRHEIYPPSTTFDTTDENGEAVTYPGFQGAFGKKNAYSIDNFFTFAYDFDRDGWNDVLTYGLPGTPAFLYVNPRGQGQHWKRHQVFNAVDNESPWLTDLTGDGTPEIVCNNGGQFGYAGPDPSNPTGEWRFHAVTQGGNWGRFTHGLGVGDINGDRRKDILFKHGWLEQPASLEGDPVWETHDFIFSPAGGAQMFAYDVNGDGRNDVITSLAAHGYGLAWFEQLRNGNEITFKTHVFMNREEKENRYGVRFSQLHAVELVDMDGDGLNDIVTGKTFWAHGPDKDPEPNMPAVVYWFKLVRQGDRVDWVPFLVDDDSGIGRQIGIADINGDGRPDIINGNKKGTFVLQHRTRAVNRGEWEKAQPKVKSDFWDQELSPAQVITRTGPR